MTASESNRRQFLRGLLGTAVGAAAPATGAVAAGKRGQREDVAAHERYTVDVFPGPPEEVWVRLVVDPADGAGDLTFALPADSSVRTARGFDRLEGRLRWDGHESPAVVYTASPDFGWAAGDGWGFARAAEVLLDAPGVETTRSVTFPRGGHAHPEPPGQSYVGPCETVTRTVAGAPVTYVRPDRWHAPAAPPASLYFDVLGTAAGMLSLPDPFPSIGYAAPSLGGSDGVAKRGATADTATPTFGFDQHSPASIPHEYVHTQQDYFVARDYQWLLEGVATFYEHCVGYRHGLTALSPLAGPAPPEPLLGARRSGVVYEKGAAVCFLLDRKLRELRDESTGLGDVLDALNEYDRGAAGSPTIGHEEFKDLVAEAAGARLDGWLDSRIAEPFEVGLPDSLASAYQGPDAPRPAVRAHPGEVTASGAADWLVAGVDVATRKTPVDALELTVAAESPGVVRLGEVAVSADDAAHEIAGRERARRGRELAVRVEFPGSQPPSLDAVPAVGVSLDALGTGASALRLSGSVTYGDGVQESLATTVTGTRALVKTAPPAPPQVVPRRVPVGQQATLRVVDPDPDAVYLWEFGTDGGVGAAGPTVTRRFDLLGEHTVEVTAVDRAGNRTAGTTTLTVAEGATPTVLDYADEECLLRERGHRRRTGDWEAGEIDRWLLGHVARACYDGDRSEGR